MLIPVARLLFGRDLHFIAFSFFAFFLLGRQSAYSQCSVTTPRTGNSFVLNNTSISGHAWSPNTPGNVALSDGNYVSNTIFLNALDLLGPGTTKYLVVKNFGFTIPSSASICGIEVTIDRKATGLISLLYKITDNSIKLVKNNNIIGAERASGSDWPDTDGSAVYGGVSDQWGSTWTPTDINSADFGVAISAKASGLLAVGMTANINRIAIRVFFNIVLPVKLTNFTATPEQDKVKLEWSTAAESNSDHFIVERSVNGTSDWEQIDSVAAVGNGTTLHHYQAYDTRFLPVNFYRLRHTDINGAVYFSPVVSLRIPRKSMELRSYPNPVHNEITALFPGRPTRISLKNMFGAEVLLKDCLPVAGGVRLLLPSLQKGYYWLIIQTGEQSYSKKILAL